MRVLIIGQPRVGKTTLATKLSLEHGVPVTHLDTLLAKFEWSQLSDHVAEMLNRDGDWIIEGCSGVRGLRKYLRKGKVPDFQIVWLSEAKVPQTGKQKAFGASCQSIYNECLQMLRRGK